MVPQRCFGIAKCYVCRYEVCEPWLQICNVSAFFHCIHLIQAIFTIIIMITMIIMIIIIIFIVIIFNILAKFVLKDT